MFAFSISLDIVNLFKLYFILTSSTKTFLMAFIADIQQPLLKLCGRCYHRPFSIKSQF